MKFEECKVALIDEKGNINMMGNAGDATFHVDYLYEYLGENHSEDFEVPSLAEEFRRDIFAYHLGTLGYIVFYNQIYEGFKYGVFYFPNDISENQLEIVKSLDLKDEKIAIAYNPTYFGSFVHFEMIGEDGEHVLADAIEDYLEKKNLHTR